MLSIEEKDQAYIWHPFTQEKKALPNIPIIKGEGAYLIDTKGNRYLDFTSSWWVNTHGHCNSYINEKIKAQLDQLEHVIFSGFTHPKAIELAEKILHIHNQNYQKVFFSDNGSTANEVAIKMAIQYYYNKNEIKPKIIAFDGSYHGDTFGAMSTSSRNEFNAPFTNNLFDTYHIPTPNENNFKNVFTQFKNHLSKGDVAAFIFEPLIQGVAGMNIYAASYLDELIDYCKSKNILTIADEVFTGFYRTGTYFAIDQLQHKPDIVCLSKGLTGGYLPLGITLCTQKIYQEFYSDERLKTFFHGHSFTGNPLSCTAACASIELFNTTETQKNIQNIIEWNTQFIKKIIPHPMVLNPRIQGTILAFEIKSHTKNYFNTLRDEIYEYFLKHQIILRPLGNTLYLCPPYCITQSEYKKVSSTILKFLNTLN